VIAVAVGNDDGVEPRNALFLEELKQAVSAIRVAGVDQDVNRVVDFQQVCVALLLPGIHVDRGPDQVGVLKPIITKPGDRGQERQSDEQIPPGFER